MSSSFDYFQRKVKGEDMASEKKEKVENVEQNIQETDAEKNMQAAEEQAVGVKKYVVKVDGNSRYCGIGAGGVQFANGKAVIDSERMAAWFREHNGYTVTEQ